MGSMANLRASVTLVRVFLLGRWRDVDHNPRVWKSGDLLNMPFLGRMKNIALKLVHFSVGYK